MQGLGIDPPGCVVYPSILSGAALSAGDAVKVSGETRVTLSQGEAAEVPLFDLP